MIRVADYIIDFVKKKGVEHIFLLPGGAAMFLNDAVALNKDMKYVAVHHEQTAAMAAEGYARLTNNFGVAMVTAGPGSTNAITGAAGAWIDSAPILVLSGQSKRVQTVRNSGLERFRQMGAQEVDIIPMVEPITKYAVMVNEPEKIRYHLEKAYYLATTGRPGPVWLDIPIDVQSSRIDENALEGFDPKELEVQESTDIAAKISELIGLIKKAERPVIVAGNGIRTSHSEQLFYELLELMDIPVVTTRLSCDILPQEDVHYAGRVGIRGNRAGNFTMQNSDLLISLGSRLSIPVTGYDYETFAREAKVVMVDIDDAELNKNTIKIDMPIKAELNTFMTQLLQSARGMEFKKNQKWVEKCNHWKKKYPTTLPEYWEEKDFANSYCLVDKLSDMLSEGDVALTDAGSAVDVVYHAFKIKKNQRMIMSGGLASMGYALPASLGVAAANKNRTICITGDGSLQMNIQELATAVHSKLPIKVIVLNNNGYLTIRGAQYTHFSGRLIGEGPESGLGFPDFEKLAEAYGMAYVRINNNSEIEEGLRKTLEIDGPVLCDAMIAPRQPSVPKQSSKALPDGRMVSSPLEDMFPFLDREEFNSEMIIKPWSEE